MPDILYLHGANMTEVGFSLIKSVLNDYKYICPEYSVHVPLKQNIKTITSIVKKTFKKPITIIGHSLGGIIAVELYRSGLPIKKIVSISSPFGGSESATKLRWFFPKYQLFDDIKTDSDVIRGLQKFHVDIPMISFVSVGGFVPLVSRDGNDGVVTIASQKTLSGPKYIEVTLNHFEILMSDTVAKEIKNFIEK